jgi:hypothetical protein
MSPDGIFFSYFHLVEVDCTDRFQTYSEAHYCVGKRALPVHLVSLKLDYC